MTRKRRYGGVKHRRDKVESHVSKYHAKPRTVSVKVEINRNPQSIGARNAFSMQYVALACPIGKGQSMPQNMKYLIAHGHSPRGRRCGDGYGKTPSAAFSAALRELAKIKR